MPSHVPTAMSDRHLRSRRKVLQTLAVAGTAATGTGGVALGTAAQSEPDPEEIIEKSLEIKREKGADAADDYLAENDISVVRKSTTLSVDEETESKRRETTASTQSLENVRTTGVKPELSGYSSWLDDDYYVTFDVELHCEVVCKDSGLLEPKRYDAESFGSGPSDGAIVAWNTPNEAYFDLVDGLDSVNFDGEFSYEERADRGAIVADVDDTQACVDWWNDNKPDGAAEGHPDQKLCATDVWGNPTPKRVEGDAAAGDVVLNLEPVNDHRPSRRTISASYTHAYEDSRFFGGDVSYGYSLGGPSVSVNPETDIKQVETDTTEGGFSDGELLEISQAEMD